MGQIIKVQRPVSSASIRGLYVISLLGVLLYNCIYTIMQIKVNRNVVNLYAPT
jgi:hypothetical protein